MDQNVVFQDNMSTMRLAINGFLSSSSPTRDIKSRYYLIKEKVDEGEVDIQYCPTERMCSNVLNKSKQGTSFKKKVSINECTYGV